MKTLRMAACVALLSFASLGAGIRKCPHASAGDSRAAYFPSVTLQTHDNKDVRFYEDLIKGKLVVINFMYTRCDGKYCGEGTKNLARVQKALGDRLGKDVFIYSITLDPEHDTPEVLEDFAKAHGAKPGWTFLTGKAKDIDILRRKLGLFNSDSSVDADRRQHTGMIRIGNEAFNKWSMTPVLSKPERILGIIERMKPPTPSKE